MRPVPRTPTRRGPVVILGFVRKQRVLPGRHLRAEALTLRPNAYESILTGGPFRLIFGRESDVPTRPRGQNQPRISGILLVTEEVVGIVQGDEALRMLGGIVEGLGVLDSHRFVERGVHDQQGSVQGGQQLGQVLTGNVFQKMLANGERPTPQSHLRLTLSLDRFALVVEVMGDVCGVGGGAERGHGPHAIQARGGDDGRRTPQGVAHHQRRGLELFCQVIRRRHEVFHVRREVRVREVALRLPESGEVEAQDSDSTSGEGTGDVDGRLEVLRAGEAVREDGVRHRALMGEFQASGESVAVSSLEFDALCRHG